MKKGLLAAGFTQTLRQAAVGLTINYAAVAALIFSNKFISAKTSKRFFDVKPYSL
ncbi:hypothetical protein [Coleofasciculus sp. FACHB-T130]|uniref:hypothetical protein n=1 Tax=Cyanophyceae TaxID=3028117 RepID=UPI00168677E4|nr:hypothetical protein [Coleofasciculus sp. FACHB-T130]MBD1879780.1 hypothetical protein [Coleofasciculus sp. FACHB-T130]